MNWFQRFGYVTFGITRKTSLQLQILLINAIGLFNLAGNNFNWGWLKGDLQLKKIWELPMLDPDNSDVKDIEWIKTILSQIVVARFIINSVSLVAHIANIYTILTRDRQNLLIFWMVLSFVKDILLEVVVVIITLILWHNGNITTLLLVEFIAKKAIRLALSIWKWCTTLNWYMQLRKTARIREFFESIARRSNMSIVDTVRRHSLDDASLCIAMVRRGKSLLSLDELSEESSNRVKFNRVYFDLRTSKSLTTLITNESYDTNGTSDYDSNAYDLSVAEKSMKMLNITAEDVMDARARIQERSYWAGQDATAKVSNSVEKMMTYFEKDGKEMEDVCRDRQTAVDSKEDDKEDNEEETVDVTEDIALEKEDDTRYSLMEEEKKTDNSETVVRNREKEIFTEEREEAANFLLVENGVITSNKVKDLTPMTSHDFCTTLREEKRGTQKAAKTVECSLSEYERNMNAKACPSLVKDMEMKVCSVSVSYEYEWIGEADQKRHPYRVETKPAAVAINANKKEHFKSSKMSLPAIICHCPSNIDIRTQNKENLQSTNDENKNVIRNTDGQKSKCFISNVVESKPDENGKSALKHLERHLKKQPRTCQECLEKQPVAWDSMSLAQTARPSGYEKRFVAPDKLSALQTNLKSVQTETSNESEDFLSTQRRSKHVQQTQHIQSSDLHLVSDCDSFKRKNCMKFKEYEMTEARTLEAFDFILLENEKQIKTRNRHNLRRKLSAEEREAIELRALKAYNKQTLLEDKKELEAKRKNNSSLKAPEIPKTEDSKTDNDVALLGRNREGTEIITGNDLPVNCEQSIEKLEASAAYSKFTSSDDCNMIAEETHDSSKHAASSICEKDIEAPTRTFNLLEANNVSDFSSEARIMNHSSKTHGNVNSNLDIALLGRNREGTEIITGNDLPVNCERSIEKLQASAAYSKFTSSDDCNMIAEETHDSSKHAASSICEKDIEAPTTAFNLLEADNVSDCPSEARIMNHLPKHGNVNSNLDSNDRIAGHTRAAPLNLWEITRNIEWSRQPGGIILINKNLQGELSENERSRESQQRDIVDNNTASILHNAFFFKPEVVIRIFRRSEMRFEEAFANFEIWRRADFSVEFICRINNEMNVQDRDFEWITGDRNNLSHSLLLNSNHIAEEENSRDLYIIFINREEFPSESETTFISNEGSAELQRSARLSVENVQPTSILVFDANRHRTDGATIDNLPAQFIINVLRNFGIEMSEESIRAVPVEQIEDFGNNMSNMTMINDFPSHVFNTNDMSDDGGSNMCDKISLSQSAYCNDMIDNKNKQILYLSNNCLSNLGASSIESLEHDNYNDSQNEEYLSATDVNLEDKTPENNSTFVNIENDVMSRSSNSGNNNDNDDNRQLSMLNNDGTNENMSNVSLENSKEVFSPNTSFIKSFSCQTSMSNSIDKELKKLTELADGRIIPENERRRSISNSGIRSSDTILQYQDVETLRLTTRARDNIRSEDEDRNVYGKVNEFWTDQFPGMYSSDESDFNPLYDNNGSSEPTLQDDSLMEEFSNDTILRTFSDIFVHNYARSLDNRN